MFFGKRIVFFLQAALLGMALIFSGLPPPAEALAGQPALASMAQVSVMGQAWQVPQLSAAIDSERPLASGVCGDDVYALEGVLYQAGYLKGSPAFRFDGETKAAVQRFQQDYGLKADGVVGEDTFVAVNELAASNGFSVTGLEISFNGDNLPAGEWIIINKTLNKLFFIREGQVSADYPVGTGATPGLTPEGKFSVVTKVINPAWGGGGYANPVPGGVPGNPLGKRWMGLSIGGGGAYGIHGNANEASIGKYVSHGCIRMHNADVEEFFPQVQVRTPVYIGTNDSLRRYGINFMFPQVVTRSYVLMAVNNQAIPDAAPLIRNGTLLVPLRQVGEALGANVLWQGKGQPVQIAYNGSTMEVAIGQADFTVDNQAFTAGAPAVLVQGRLMVPLDMYAHLQGVNVGWEPETKTIRVTSGLLPLRDVTGKIEL